MLIEIPDDYYDFAASVSATLDRSWSTVELRRLGEDQLADDAELWRDLARLGTGLLTLASSLGGEGLPLTATTLVLEEVGKRCVALPVVETVAVAIPSLCEVDSTLARELATSIASGDGYASIQEGWEGFAPRAAEARVELVHDGEDTIHLCGPAEPGSRVPSTDASRRLARVSPTTLMETVVSPGIAQRARVRGVAGTAVTLAGCSAAAVRSALDYAGVRVQFGRTIGSFQAVKHLLANAHFAAETTRRSGWVALALDPATPTGAEAASTAKYVIGEAAQQASYASLQVHGGIGYTWDCDLQLWLKRIQALNAWFGTPDHHLGLLASAARSTVDANEVAHV